MSYTYAPVLTRQTSPVLGLCTWRSITVDMSRETYNIKRRLPRSRPTHPFINRFLVYTRIRLPMRWSLHRFRFWKSLSVEKLSQSGKTANGEISRHWQTFRRNSFHATHNYKKTAYGWKRWNGRPECEARGTDTGQNVDEASDRNNWWLIVLIVRSAPGPRMIEDMARLRKAVSLCHARKYSNRSFALDCFMKLQVPRQRSGILKIFISP